MPVPAAHACPRKPAPTRARGFTLIELMLGVALIGVLMTVAIPAYQGWRNKALSRQAAQEITMISTGIKQYAIEAQAYPADLSALPYANAKDPWGQPYVYYNVQANGKGGARKDKKLNPINSDFDFYSLGPDGVTKKQVSQKDSLDDIIRGNDGAFVGVAADF